MGITGFYIRTHIAQTKVNVELMDGKIEGGIFIDLIIGKVESEEYSTFLRTNNSVEYFETKNRDLIIEIYHDNIKSIRAAIPMPNTNGLLYP